MEKNKKKVTERKEVYYMICSWCKKQMDETFIDAHHYIPIYITKDKQKSDPLGRVNICRKCHNILHKYLESYYWKMLPTQTQAKILATMKKMQEDLIFRYDGRT